MDSPTEVFALAMRRLIIEESRRANVGHIGSALSVADILAALFCRTLNISQPRDSDRDRFILSKGHAALALYAALYLRGWLSRSELSTFCTNGSLLGSHPDHRLVGVDFSTGSLGQGLAIGSGAALAARLQCSTRRTFVLISDAECNEGALWEAAMFAAHHRLTNLIAVLDLNGQQALGYTHEVLSLAPLADKWEAFGWDVHAVDGHSPDAIADTIASFNFDGALGKPRILLARTVLGKGVSYMEGQIRWHYMPMSNQQYRQACRELGVV